MMKARALACALAAGGLLAACVDTSPIDYVPPEAGPPEAAPADAQDKATLVASCRTCLTQGACMSDSEACLKDARCSQFLNCLIDSYCLNYDVTNSASYPPCLTGCSADSGVEAQSDPVIAIFIPVFGCAQSPDICGGECDVQ